MFKMSRPVKYTLDPNRIAQLAADGCSAEEIATLVTPEDEANLGHVMDHRVLERRYGPALKSGRNRMKGMIRSMAIQEMKAGNTAVLIFLMKTVLGMRERSPLDGMAWPSGTITDSEGQEKPYTERNVMIWLREVMPSIERVTREVESEVEVFDEMPEIRDLTDEESENRETKTT
jgi:hypothetical protein